MAPATPPEGRSGAEQSVGRSVGPRGRIERDPVYCCFGCRMAHAITEERGQEGAVRWTIVRLGIAIFFSMNLMAFTMTMWSLDVYDVQRDPFQTQLFEVFRWLSMLFSFPVLLLLGVPMLQNAIHSWRQRIFSTDLLIATGVVAAVPARSVIEHTELVREIRAHAGVHMVETWIHAAVWAERYEWTLDRLERLQDS